MYIHRIHICIYSHSASYLQMRAWRRGNVDSAKERVRKEGIEVVITRTPPPGHLLPRPLFSCPGSTSHHRHQPATLGFDKGGTGLHSAHIPETHYTPAHYILAGRRRGARHSNEPLRTHPAVATRGMTPSCAELYAPGCLKC